ISYLIYRDSSNEYWKKRIENYISVSDSLKKVTDEIDKRTKSKDSILLFYMASLDKTLEELNKETKKNKDTIRVNENKQELIISEYCRYMQQELKQKPDVCK